MRVFRVFDKKRFFECYKKFIAILYVDLNAWHLIDLVQDFPKERYRKKDEEVSNSPDPMK